MKLVLLKLYLTRYDTEDAKKHENEIITDDPKRFVADEKERHGDNFAGYNVANVAPAELYRNVIVGLNKRAACAVSCDEERDDG